jgi:O-antigen ligase
MNPEMGRRAAAVRWYCLALAVAIPICLRLSIGGYRVSPSLGDLMMAVGVVGILVTLPARKLLLGPFLPYVALTLVATAWGFACGRITAGTVAAETFKIIAVYGYAVIGAHLLGTEDRLKVFLTTCRWMGAFEALLGVAGSVLLTRFDIHLPFSSWRAVGTLPTANVLGAYLVFCLVCSTAVYHLQRARTRSFDLAYAGTSLLMVAGIVASGTRGSLLALLVAVVFYGLIFRKRGAGLLLLAAGTSAGAVALAMAFFPGVAGRIIADPRSSQSVENRLRLWRFGWETFRDAPVVDKLVGLGRGSFIALTKGQSGLTPANTHNTPLLLLTETGILGLGAFLVLVGWVSAGLIRVWGRLEPGLRVALGVYWFGGLALAVQGLTNDVTEFRPLWLLLGLAYGVVKARDAGTGSP